MLVENQNSVIYLWHVIGFAHTITTNIVLSKVFTQPKLVLVSK